MSRFKNFREFYEKELRSDLEIIDQKRKRVNRRVFCILSLTAMAVTAEILLIPDTLDLLRGMIPFLTGVAGMILTGIFSRSYRKEYKKRIIARLTNYVDEGLTYTPEGSVSLSGFLKSGIFPSQCDRFRGEDHFTGMMGKTAIEFSEVHAEQRNRSESGSSQQNEFTTIFRGLFIVADFNKHFRTRTAVLPDNAERIFGKFGQSLQSISSDRGKLIRLEDPLFEKEFCVYGDDQVEARYILTPSLMQRIMAFRQKWKTRIYLSFRDSNVYIAIPLNKNLFEMRPFKTVANYSFMEKNLRFLILLTDIVEDLNLNTRIWTKE
ncbi:MAG: DUF3137 domain-containing protein [Bacteroidales bacterium]|nr:DUF3137 domain-containing protein [Bacteroidales bacterium]MBN2698928.1 DUF3137 domain-containing protein [Bacteroidales bacterium]